MPWLPFYAVESDLELVVRWLNEDDEIGFILSDGPKRWVARKSIAKLTPGRYCLWHIPSGPLPLLPPQKRRRPGSPWPRAWAVVRQIGSLLLPSGARQGREPDYIRIARDLRRGWKSIRDPWRGWVELRTGADSKVPYFADHPGIILLTISISTSARAVPLCGFEWIGNRYRPIGLGALQATERWWNSMRGRVRRASSRVARGGLPELGGVPALSGAVEALQNGAEAVLNPTILWDQPPNG